MASKTVVQPPQRPFGNLSDKQVVLVLEVIATNANTLRKLLARAYSEHSLTEAGEDLDVATNLAEQIGALADFACGEDIVGNVGDWLVGPAFHDAKEVSRG